MRRSLSWFAAASVLALPMSAYAQAPKTPTARPAPKGAGQMVEGVVVTGQSSGVRTDIDRRSYGVANDLQATSGSISDALRNIPSVQVDVQGNVSLRGDPNVEILIDGKPSGMFRGEGRAAALQALPADQIERVEVLTNPSAAFNPEGSAGVINLITKQNRRLGASGSVRANVGTDGRWNVGVSGARNDGKVTLSGDIVYRNDQQKLRFDDQRERRDTATAAFLENRGLTQVSNDLQMVFGRLGLDYDPSARDRLTLGLVVHAIRPESESYDHIEYDDAAGRLARVLDRIGRAEFARDNIDLSGSWRRKFSGEDHELSVNVSREWNRTDNDAMVESLSRLPLLPPAYEIFDNRTRARQWEVKADYTRPMPGDGKLKTGYALQRDDNTYRNVFRRGAAPTGLPVDPTLSYDFDFDQAINAVYATYQQPFGQDLKVLAGLRLEDVRVDLALQPGAVAAENDYFRAYPSLHLQYDLGEGQQVTAGYSRRIQRPSGEDLNPFRIYSGPFNFRQGNPNLEPQVTDAYEVVLQRRRNGTFYQATLFYRDSSKGFTDVVSDLGGGVYLTTKENLRSTRSGGVELVANGRLNPKLTYNLSGNLFWSEVDASQLGFAGNRSGYTLSGRGNVNYQLTPKDFLQVNGFMSGKRLNAQGYVEGFSMLNLGYRHKFNDQYAVVFTAQDVLGTFKETQVYDTPLLQGRIKRRFSQRGAFVGVVYTFGKQRQRDPGFDFGQGTPPT